MSRRVVTKVEMRCEVGTDYPPTGIDVYPELSNDDLVDYHARFGHLATLENIQVRESQLVTAHIDYEVNWTVHPETRRYVADLLLEVYMPRLILDITGVSYVAVNAALTLKPVRFPPTFIIDFSSCLRDAEVLSSVSSYTGVITSCSIRAAGKAISDIVKFNIHSRWQVQDPAKTNIVIGWQLLTNLEAAVTTLLTGDELSTTPLLASNAQGHEAACGNREEEVSGGR